MEYRQADGHDDSFKHLDFYFMEKLPVKRIDNEEVAKAMKEGYY